MVRSSKTVSELLAQAEMLTEEEQLQLIARLVQRMHTIKSRRRRGRARTEEGEAWQFPAARPLGTFLAPVDQWRELANERSITADGES